MSARVCGQCLGFGIVREVHRDCSHSGNCGCAVNEEEVTCDACDGTGDVLCDNCREHAGMETIGDDFLCAACAAERKERLAA